MGPKQGSARPDPVACRGLTRNARWPWPTTTCTVWAYAASAAALQGYESAWANTKRGRLACGVEWLLPQGAVHWARVQAAAWLHERVA